MADIEKHDSSSDEEEQFLSKTQSVPSHVYSSYQKDASKKKIQMVGQANGSSKNSILKKKKSPERVGSPISSNGAHSVSPKNPLKPKTRSENLLFNRLHPTSSVPGHNKVATAESLQAIAEEDGLPKSSSYKSDSRGRTGSVDTKRNARAESHDGASSRKLLNKTESERSASGSYSAKQRGGGRKAPGLTRSYSQQEYGAPRTDSIYDNVYANSQFARTMTYGAPATIRRADTDHSAYNSSSSAYDRHYYEREVEKAEEKDYFDPEGLIATQSHHHAANLARAQSLREQALLREQSLRDQSLRERAAERAAVASETRDQSLRDLYLVQQSGGALGGALDPHHGPVVGQPLPQYDPFTGQPLNNRNGGGTHPAVLNALNLSAFPGLAGLTPAQLNALGSIGGIGFGGIGLAGLGAGLGGAGAGPLHHGLQGIGRGGGPAGGGLGGPAAGLGFQGLGDPFANLASSTTGHQDLYRKSYNGGSNLKETLVGKGAPPDHHHGKGSSKGKGKFGKTAYGIPQQDQQDSSSIWYNNQYNRSRGYNTGNQFWDRDDYNDYNNYDSNDYDNYDSNRNQESRNRNQETRNRNQESRNRNQQSRKPEENNSSNLLPRGKTTGAQLVAGKNVRQYANAVFDRHVKSVDSPAKFPRQITNNSERSSNKTRNGSVVGVSKEEILKRGKDMIWHEESLRMGDLEKNEIGEDRKIFVKGNQYNDLLSTLSESVIRHGGRHRYCIRFREYAHSKKEVRKEAEDTGFSMADGIGFVFSNKLPCAKNIQRIQSVFVSRKGIVCIRRKADVTRCKEFMIRPFEDGDYIFCEIDLEEGTCAFWVEYPESNGKTAGPPQGSRFSYADCFPQFSIGKLDKGFITAVIKYEGVSAEAVSYDCLREELESDDSTGGTEVIARQVQ